jgi:hypothetical protein
VVPAGFAGALQLIVTPPAPAAGTLLASVNSPYFNPTLAPQIVSGLAVGAQAYAPQALGVTIPAEILPVMEQYITNQLQLVVSSGRTTLMADVGAVPPVYSLAQLQIDAALFGARRAASTSPMSAMSDVESVWLDPAYHFFVSLLAQLAPGEALANPCSGQILTPGSSCSSSNDIKPPAAPPVPPGCDPKDIQQKLSSPSGTLDLALHPPDCRMSKGQCEAMPGYKVIQYPDGTAACVEQNCGKTYTTQRGRTVSDFSSIGPPLFRSIPPGGSVTSSRIA